MQIPQSHILEALQKLDPDRRSQSDHHKMDMEDQERSETLSSTVRRTLEGNELAKLENLAADLQNYAKELSDRIQALKDRRGVQDEDGRRVGGEKTGGLLQTSASLHSNKRPPSASNDKTNVKRTRA